MKNIIIVLTLLAPMLGHGINMSVIKTRTINGQGGKGVSGTDINSRNSNAGFKDSWSRHFYEICISNVSKKDTESTYRIRILPILKFCKGGISFPWTEGEVEESNITVDQRKRNSYVYVSPLTKWTKDTWAYEDGSLLGGDMSKGIINSSIVIELIRESDGAVVRKWTNTTLSIFTSTKTIDEGIIKNKEKSFLEEHIYPKLEEDGQYIDENARIEETTWKAFNSKKHK